MASPRQIREAFINLMSEKDANKALLSNVGDSDPNQIQALQQARQQAREVQGEDPLARTLPEHIEARPPEQGFQTVRGAAPGDPMRLPDADYDSPPAQRFRRDQSKKSQQEAEEEDVRNFEAAVSDVMSGKRDIREVPRPVAEEVIRRDLELGEQ
jgi:hypothetical protein